MSATIEWGNDLTRSVAATRCAATTKLVTVVMRSLLNPESARAWSMGPVRLPFGETVMCCASAQRFAVMRPSRSGWSRRTAVADRQ